MGKIIGLNKEKKNSLLSHIIYGTLYEFGFFGKRFQAIGKLYELKKQKEFFNNYWGRFIEGINDINPNLEFDINHIANKYDSLSDGTRMQVMLDCSKIYASNDKLTYADFIRVIDSYFSKEELEKFEFFEPDGAA